MSLGGLRKVHKARPITTRITEVPTVRPIKKRGWTAHDPLNCVRRLFGRELYNENTIEEVTEHGLDNEATAHTLNPDTLDSSWFGDKASDKPRWWQFWKWWRSRKKTALPDPATLNTETGPPPRRQEAPSSKTPPPPPPPISPPTQVEDLSEEGMARFTPLSGTTRRPPIDPKKTIKDGLDKKEVAAIAAALAARGDSTTSAPDRTATPTPKPLSTTSDTIEFYSRKFHK